MVQYKNSIEITENKKEEKMNLPNLFTKFYLDKEKDIVVKLFKSEN